MPFILANSLNKCIEWASNLKFQFSRILLANKIEVPQPSGFHFFAFYRKSPTELIKQSSVFEELFKTFHQKLDRADLIKRSAYLRESSDSTGYFSVNSIVVNNTEQHCRALSILENSRSV